MTEITITTNKLNHLIDPSLHIWNWEIPLYLFLGGIAAGILIISSLVHFFKQESKLPTAANKIPILAAIFVSIGMGALFLDLEHKLYVWRFYTAFRITSPMSWGAWILVLFYPVNILLFLATVRRGLPTLLPYLENSRIQKLMDWSEKNVKGIAIAGIPTGIALGIYTGVLLSAYVARPFWNSAILGPLFLVSGLGTALALVLLITKVEEEYKMISKLDMVVIGAEILFLILFFIGMATGSEKAKEALDLVFGGPYTTKFWVWVFGLGLIFPLILETFEIKGKHIPAWTAPLFVLIGGFMFRWVMVFGGQMVGWINY